MRQALTSQTGSQQQMSRFTWLGLVGLSSLSYPGGMVSLSSRECMKREHTLGISSMTPGVVGDFIIKNVILRFSKNKYCARFGLY